MCILFHCLYLNSLLGYWSIWEELAWSLHQGRFRFDIRGNFLMERIVKHWNHSWKCSETMWIWHLRTWASGDRGLMLHSVISEVFTNFHNPPLTLWLPIWCSQVTFNGYFPLLLRRCHHLHQPPCHRRCQGQEVVQRPQEMHLLRDLCHLWTQRGESLPWRYSCLFLSSISLHP